MNKLGRFLSEKMHDLLALIIRYFFGPLWDGHSNGRSYPKTRKNLSGILNFNINLAQRRLVLVSKMVQILVYTCDVNLKYEG